MADKKFTREEYERITKENMVLFANLDKQIAKEREKENEYLATLSDEERVKYLWETDQKINAEAKGMFKSTVTLEHKDD